MFRSKADRFIDHAHSEIASAEMEINHSFTDADKAKAGANLTSAQRYLSRAVAARDAWNAVDHDDYEQYPNVPRYLSDEETT